MKHIVYLVTILLLVIGALLRIGILKPTNFLIFLLLGIPLLYICYYTAYIPYYYFIKHSSIIIYITPKDAWIPAPKLAVEHLPGTAREIPKQQQYAWIITLCLVSLIFLYLFSTLTYITSIKPAFV